MLRCTLSQCEKRCESSDCSENNVRVIVSIRSGELSVNSVVISSGRQRAFVDVKVHV